MKNILFIIIFIVLCVLLLVDIFFPVIIAFYTENWFLLFLYAVWWVPIVFGFLIVGSLIRLLAELWD